MVATALIIFGFTYLAVSAQRVPYFRLDRTSGAMVGAVAMVASGVLSINQAYDSINLNTIVLLLGMMIVVAYLELSGFFDLVSTFIFKRANTGRRLLLTIIVSSGLLSAFLVNDTICLMITPLILLLAGKSKVNPKPYLIALATSANIGSVSTLVGNPQNMIVGTSSHWPYLSFFVAMLPISLVGLIIDYFILSMFFRRELGRELKPEVVTHPHALDKPLLYKALGTMGVMIAGFSAGAEMAFMAILGASILILLANKRPDEIFTKVNWSLLLFFGSLFVVVGGINKVGLVDDAHKWLAEYFSTSVPRQIATFSLASLVMSNIVSNVPYVLIVQHWIGSFAAPRLMWLVLAMSSTFAGNLTVAGSVANMIVLELSKERAQFGFWEFTRVSGTVAIASWLAGTSVLAAYSIIGRF